MAPKEKKESEVQPKEKLNAPKESKQKEKKPPARADVALPAPAPQASKFAAYLVQRFDKGEEIDPTQLWTLAEKSGEASEHASNRRLVVLLNAKVLTRQFQPKRGPLRQTEDVANRLVAACMPSYSAAPHSTGLIKLCAQYLSDMELDHAVVLCLGAWLSGAGPMAQPLDPEQWTDPKDEVYQQEQDAVPGSSKAERLAARVKELRCMLEAAEKKNERTKFMEKQQWLAEDMSGVAKQLQERKTAEVGGTRMHEMRAMHVFRCMPCKGNQVCCTASVFPD